MTESEEPTYEITGAIAEPKTSSKAKGRTAKVGGALAAAGVVALLSAKKKKKSKGAANSTEAK